MARRIPEENIERIVYGCTRLPSSGEQRCSSFTVASEMVPKECPYCRASLEVLFVDAVLEVGE